MKSNLPLLAIGAPDSKKTAIKDESGRFLIERVPDELKIVILTAMRQPESICGVVEAWTRLRKVKEGPVVWIAVLNEMKVPDMFHPVAPTADDVKKLCQNMSSERGAEALLNETLLRDDIVALQWAMRLYGLDMTRKDILARAAEKGAMGALEFLHSAAMKIDVRSVHEWSPRAMRQAVSNGRIEAAKFLLNALPNDDSFNDTLAGIAAQAAVKYKKVAFLRWLTEQPQYNVPWDMVAILGAQFNNLEVMQFALDNGETFWDLAAMKAAEYGHIDAMEFAHKNGATDDNGTLLYSAAATGKLNAVKWLLVHFQHSISSLNLAISAAALFGSEDVVQFLRSKLEPLLAAAMSALEEDEAS